MTNKNLHFRAKIDIIGINPFVFVPKPVLQALFLEAGQHKGKIPVKMKIDGHEFPQTLVKYAGHWRLYLNTPMRDAARKQVGDEAEFEVRFDPEERIIPMHPKLQKALGENSEAKQVFDQASPSLRLEITCYIANLKTEESVDRNVARAINFLLGKERFIGLDQPKI